MHYRILRWQKWILQNWMTVKTRTGANPFPRAHPSPPCIPGLKQLIVLTFVCFPFKTFLSFPFHVAHGGGGQTLRCVGGGLLAHVALALCCLLGTDFMQLRQIITATEKRGQICFSWQLVLMTQITWQTSLERWGGGVGRGGGCFHFFFLCHTKDRLHYHFLSHMQTWLSHQVR